MDRIESNSKTALDAAEHTESTNFDENMSHTTTNRRKFCSNITSDQICCRDRDLRNAQSFLQCRLHSRNIRHDIHRNNNSHYLSFNKPISLEGRKATGSLKSFALFFGTSMFALAAFAELMPIKNRMTKPANFTSVCGVVNVAMVPITLLYLTMGIFGYLAYGANTQNPITLNLPQTGIIGDLICGLLAGSVFLSFPIGFYVVVEELWHKNLKLKFGRSKYLDQWEYGIRTVLTFTTVLCCIAIPNLELFMALVGSLMMPAVGLWFPAIMHILTFWNEYTGFKRVLLIFKISILIFTGVFALVVSVSVTLLEIYETVL
ncbi:proton-coupled amino acid transporter-like protein acs isoform X1 [Bemisia tabaci]|uniref:proton-coupled amino acid transporter-like protein acs isoform X1 n=1 Tax=Bemisia tabaci TaxID=7038 RepID=UPI003B285048